MRNFILFITACLLPVLFNDCAVAQDAAIDPCANLENIIFKENQVNVLRNISYAGNKSIPDFHSAEDKADGRNSNCNSGTGCNNSIASFVYDVYFPNPSAYSEYNKTPLPGVFLFHGGGFSDCSDKDNESMDIYCKAFAQRGYVAYNIEYRRGRVKDGTKLSPEQILAFYRAVQDARGAIRSIIKRQIDNETAFKLDTSKLFIGGSSAGGIIALFTAFCNQSEVDNPFPGVSNSDILGPIDRNDYHGSLSLSFSIKGVLNLWGGLYASGNSDPNIPPSIKSSDNVPVIAFHGKQDRTIPCASVKKNFSKSARATAKQCDFTYKIASANGFDYVYGSEMIYNRLKSLGIPSELYLDRDAGHGMDKNATYGLSSNNKESLRNYIVVRAATFFQAVINNTAGSIQKTKFEDTKNNRTGCSNNNNLYVMENAALKQQIYAEKPLLNIQVLPNPTATEFKLTMQSSNNANVEIIVTDMYGRKVYYTKGSVNQSFSFGRNLASGIYVVQVLQNKNIQTLKLVKEK